MKAFILAAGLGTRLLPLTKTTPKPLVRVQGVPLILYSLALLKKFGITEVVINTHHLGDMLISALGDGKRLGFALTYSRENPILGTGGGIAKILPQMSQDFLVINSDVITDFEIGDLLGAHQKIAGLSTLILRPQTPGSSLGILTCRDQVITSILPETPPSDHAPLHFTGVHLISQQKLQNFLKNRNLPPSFCIVRDVYKPCFAEHFSPLGAFVQKGFWEDCGTFEALRKMEGLALNLSYQVHVQDLLQKFNV